MTISLRTTKPTMQNWRNIQFHTLSLAKLRKLFHIFNTSSIKQASGCANINWNETLELSLNCDFRLCILICIIISSHERTSKYIFFAYNINSLLQHIIVYIVLTLWEFWCCMQSLKWWLWYTEWDWHNKLAEGSQFFFYLEHWIVKHVSIKSMCIFPNIQS